MLLAVWESVLFSPKWALCVLLVWLVCLHLFDLLKFEAPVLFCVALYFVFSVLL